jgi:single-strand DNA-binding protein
MPATITIVGNLGRDPETRYTPNGRMNVALNVAVSHRFRDSSGEQQERTNWFRVTAWGTLAETLDRLAQQGWLVKGRQVFVSGRFEARDYQDNTGATRTSLDISANEVSLVGGRPDSESGASYAGSGAATGGSRSQQPGRSEQNLDDLPDSGGDIDDIPF